MRSRRVLLVWFDGYDPATGDALMAEGRLPALARLKAASARFALDHGPARWTGLAGEHFSTGVSDIEARRNSALHFNPEQYTIWQEGTRQVPFPAVLKARTVVLDPTYFSLARAPNVRGIVHWGAHDPGAPPTARPRELEAEFKARFGRYPEEWIHGYVWPSPGRAEAMGASLVRATELRTEATLWLLKERCPDWDLAIVGGGELHSAAESLWHGWDPAHPLNRVPSAAAARAGFIAAYEAADRMIARLTEAFADAAIVVCAMHGMGPNTSDVASMALLPELLFRWHFGTALQQGRPEWSAAADGVPMLAESDTWWPGVCERGVLPADAWPKRLRKRATLDRAMGTPWPGDAAAGACISVEAIPATWYRPFWPTMRAFALPSYYDGRIRVNLAGREAQGCVPRWAYPLVLNSLERLLRATRDITTGAPVVRSIVRPARRDPMALEDMSADMIVVWQGAHLGFAHRRLGRVGPLPYQRPGGHTGGHGMAYLAGCGLAPGDHGSRSAFDVVPTVIDLLGEAKPAHISGASLLPDAMRATLPMAAE
jgi:predicted AlkP superfamily phosphohydrolase/phosphomutase